MEDKRFGGTLKFTVCKINPFIASWDWKDY